MLNFPMPYPDELLYSTIARAGVHMGITSPKELLDDVFADRKVVATPDLPGYLRAIAGQYPPGAGLSVEALAYRHTLFPLYAPFVPEKRRQQSLRLLEGSTQGTLHLCLGIAASRVKQPNVLRVCPGCVDEQIVRHGEPYWKRGWQIRGADACPQHGRLMDTPLPRYAVQRHAFVPLVPDLIPSARQDAGSEEDSRVARRTWELLDLPPQPSPTFDQWSRYYALLATEQGCTAGQHMAFSLIVDRIFATWPPRWLEGLGLQVMDSPSCWLRGIFRRHRKALSYLEHLIVLEAFLDRKWTFRDVLRQVVQLPKARPAAVAAAIRPNRVDRSTLDKRRSWRVYLKRYGVKLGRRLGGGALYAALYRRDRAWLLKINKRYHIHACRKNSRVDWSRRDQAIEGWLCDIKWSRIMDLNTPRRSKLWYLKQAGPVTTVTNHLAKLPLTAAFLDRSCESVEQYQVRRIRAAMRELAECGLPIKRWRLLRLAGLSEARLKPPARTLLSKVE